jgi:N-acetylglucosamine-6-sulfatase
MRRGTMGNMAAESKDADTFTRREALQRIGMAGLLVTGAGAVLEACGASNKKSTSPTSTSPASQRRSGSKSGSPNVLLIVADDMRYDQVQFMPFVRQLIVDKGRTFSQARCNVPLCQPARVGLMTGQTSRYNNELSIGYDGTKLTDNDNCIGNWMHEAGYRCGFFGKYINFTDALYGIKAPAGYEVWREFNGETNAYEFRVRMNTSRVTIKGQYSSDYLAAEANKFLQGSSEPFFCVVTPSQPHEPFWPRKDLAHKWLNYKFPIVDEVDVSDKPPWMQALPPLTKADKAQIEKDAIGALQELSAVDDMVRKILTAMDPAVLDRTVVIFTSDNGVHHGEHRCKGAGTKSGPYEVALRVPLLFRGPGFAPGPAVTVPSLLTQDIAATILDLGGAKAGLPHQGGISLVDVCANPAAYSQRTLLHEIGNGFVALETGDGITTGPDNSAGFRKLYRYPSIRKNPNGPFIYEAYDLDTDENELSNWANNPARRPERDALEAKLKAELAV